MTHRHSSLIRSVRGSWRDWQGLSSSIRRCGGHRILVHIYDEPVHRISSRHTGDCLGPIFQHRYIHHRRSGSRGIPIDASIPMVMGANAGMTVTNTLVNFGHVNRPGEFRNAFAAATKHDFFNLLSILIFLPLELAFGFLEKLGGMITLLVENIGTVDVLGKGIVKVVVGSGTRFVESLVSSLPDPWASSVLIFVGIALILLLIMYLGNALKSVFVGGPRISCWQTSARVRWPTYFPALWLQYLCNRPRLPQALSCHWRVAV